ncbi:MAG: hypothetical protein ACLFP4_12365 [Spirochaetales bacterium]
MFSSDRFLKRLAKLRKEQRDAPREEQVELTRELFLGFMRSLPPQMADEVFDSFNDRIVERMGEDELYFDAARYLADVADLFAEQYDTEHDPLVRDDWVMVGEIVNDFALDLEMETVNYVMRLVVEHHGVEGPNR